MKVYFKFTYVLPVAVVPYQEEKNNQPYIKHTVTEYKVIILA